MTGKHNACRSLNATAGTGAAEMATSHPTTGVRNTKHTHTTHAHTHTHSLSHAHTHTLSLSFVFDVLLAVLYISDVSGPTYWLNLAILVSDGPGSCHSCV